MSRKGLVLILQGEIYQKSLVQEYLPNLSSWRGYRCPSPYNRATRLWWIFSRGASSLEVRAHSRISYHALFGGHSPTLLHFKVHIRGSLIVVLVDNGSIYNFIQPRATKFLNFVISPITNFPMVMGNDRCLKCEGVVCNVLILIKEYIIRWIWVFLHSMGSMLFLRLHGWPL